MNKSFRLLFSIALLTLILTSCGEKISSEKLYGKWNYIKVEGIRSQEESLTEQEVAAEAPSITFYENGNLVIIWGDQILSKGKFKVEGDIIRFTESLPDGVTRPIPFLVKKLNKTHLVFETMEEQATRISAKKDQ